jgi:hypothetical protein
VREENTGLDSRENVIDAVRLPAITVFCWQFYGSECTENNCMIASYHIHLPTRVPTVLAWKSQCISRMFTSHSHLMNRKLMTAESMVNVRAVQRYK